MSKLKISPCTTFVILVLFGAAIFLYFNAPLKNDGLDTLKRHYTDRHAVDFWKLPVTEYYTDTDAVDFWKMSVPEREKFQQAQAWYFCDKHGLDSTESLNKLFLVTNDKERTISCFPPKVGCTSLKILFFLAQGAVRSDEVNKEHEIIHTNLERPVREHSFVNLRDSAVSYKLENYYKFIMYRDPAERLVSAYRDKVEKYPLLGLKNDIPHFNWIRKGIYEFNQPDKYNKWRSKNGITPINITFSDFINFWIHGKGTIAIEPHFLPIFDICHPCRVGYNYYGNFKTFDQDAKVLIELIRSNDSLLRKGYYNDSQMTSNISPEYYRQLSIKQKKMVVNKLAWDLSFYYAIFPTEKDSHKEIMDINYDVPEIHKKNNSLVHSSQWHIIFNLMIFLYMLGLSI